MADAIGLQQVSIYEGKVKIFQRKNSKFWWVGIHHQGKYHRESTKEIHLKDAKVFAEEWYFTKRGQIKEGRIPETSKSFQSCAKSALADYQSKVNRGERSINTFKGIKICLDAHILDFFKNKNIARVDNQSWYAFKEYMYEKNPLVKRGTLHQYKNAIRTVLNYAYQNGTIKELPIFKDSHKKIDVAPRPYFTHQEYYKLLAGVRNHIKNLEDVQPRWVNAGLELYDYIIFAVNTGMRVSEISNLRYCDIQVKQEKTKFKDKSGKYLNKEYLEISNIKGKRGTGTCKSYYGATKVFYRCIERNRIENPTTSKTLMFKEHHRDMFRSILKETELRYTNNQPPLKRDFVSLRSTYICWRLLDGVPIYDIEKNCRTSADMIQKHYARYLSASLLKNINRGIIQDWDE